MIICVKIKGSYDSLECDFEYNDLLDNELWCKSYVLCNSSTFIDYVWFLNCVFLS